jgi:hypothetical protein
MIFKKKYGRKNPYSDSRSWRLEPTHGENVQHWLALLINRRKITRQASFGMVGGNQKIAT